MKERRDQTPAGRDEVLPFPAETDELRRLLENDETETSAVLREVIDRVERESRQEPPELGELRGLMFGGEIDRLNRLETRMDDPSELAEDVSRRIAEGLAAKDPRQDLFKRALIPVVEEAIRDSIRRNPKVLVDVLFPIMGPAIRKAIAAALAGMVSSLNSTLENSFSWQGLKWRLEARATGRPFGEVVLSHTLIYQVEQVFLVHKETGLLLCHVTSKEEDIRDPDLISGMLTALQDFVKDSFSTDQGDMLETMQVGEYTVRIEQGPAAILAAVVRGAPPVEVSNRLQNALERIHLEKGTDLTDFEGDTDVFEDCRPILEECLDAQYGAGRSGEQSGNKVLRLAYGLIGVLVLVFGTWMFFSLRESRRWNDFLTRLRAEPGIVVTDYERRGGRYLVAGLRDPDAADPDALARAASIAPDRLDTRWEPYVALSPKLVVARARRMLETPATVTTEFDNGELKLAGHAPHRWIAQAVPLARTVPGVTRIRTDGLKDSEREAIEATGREIEAIRLGFALNAVEPLPGQDEAIQKLVKLLETLRDTAKIAGVPVSIEVFGQADGVGSVEYNRQLSQRRAEYFQKLFAAQTGGAVTFRAIGLGIAATGGETPAQRSVSFRVSVGEAAQVQR